MTAYPINRDFLSLPLYTHLHTQQKDRRGDFLFVCLLRDYEQLWVTFARKRRITDQDHTGLVCEI